MKCGNCGAVAPFRWLGGMHDCSSGDGLQPPLLVILPDDRSPGPPVCGNALRNRVVMTSYIEDEELEHLTRYMERIREDDEVTMLRVMVRSEGTLEFAAPGFIYSAPVGAAE
ncbi:hypothetical protein ACQI4F_23725 [Mycolicibacterium vaccae]|uniref:hypothetical protein n=1 Tax=Mycolicibacterium vaccae TaxID=1810 RepID=UPI003CE7C611